jgi:hypothetical protein
MSDAADLVCFDDTFGLELGWFWNTAQPRFIWTPTGVAASQVPELSRALWRLVVEHIYHDLRLLGEVSPDWAGFDVDGSHTVGGDRTVGGWDPSVEQYVDNWPDVTTLPDADGPTEPDFASLACLDCGIVLPLGSFWANAEPGARYIVTADGTPAFEHVDTNRALWKMLAEHVYHPVRVIGRRSPLVAQLDRPDVIVIGGDREGIDLSARDYLADWPG